jgi:hypothetical protein
VTQQLTQQELAVGASRWACRTWVSGSYGLPKSWDHGQNVGVDQRIALQAAEIMGSWKSNVHYLLENRPLRSWRSWGRKCPTIS